MISYAVDVGWPGATRLSSLRLLVMNDHQPPARRCGTENRRLIWVNGQAHYEESLIGEGYDTSLQLMRWNAGLGATHRRHSAWQTF